MSERRQALGRIWTLLWIAVVGYVLTVIVMIIAAIWAILDIAWQLISGRNTFSEDRSPARLTRATVKWAAGQTVYGLTGAGDRRWRALPTS